MPNRVKRIETDPQQRARSAMLATLRAVAATTPDHQYSVGNVCLLIPCNVKTLFNARKKRTDALKKGQPISPLELESIPFVPKQNPTYMASHLVQYLDRLMKSTGMSPADATDPGKYQTFAVRAVLGFQNWLDEAGPHEQWPFAMQKSGRPMDLIAATLSQQITKDIRWLTIREFGEIAAHAASEDFAEAEQEIFRHGLKKPADDEPSAPISRWEKPGGPM